ncbi:porin [Cupriavidus oxalaticus]|uniref:Porin n=1 Tax=Cupriavidus oxalaticus TaxID=96344 RepID=A0A5P3VGJ1_9BURK|nr:porin [Cupriavidus oxalaticus]QEZ44351.1 porin [Cupriavidus oxalaticus]
MKKLFLTGIAACCGIAHAQSSVTLYGMIDGGINYTSNIQTGRGPNGALTGASQTAMLDGGQGGVSGSRWGMRGTEDLGGGVKALFQLEGGFNFDSGTMGQGGALFGRQAFVGVSTRYGTVTLGRQYDSMRDYVQPYAATAYTSGVMGARPGDFDNLANSRRINRAIKYTSNTYNGLVFGGLYSLGGVAGDVTQNQLWSVGVRYSGGPLSFGAAYVNARNPNLSYFGTNPNASKTPSGNNMGSVGSATSAQYNPIFAGFSSARSLQLAGAGVSYAFGNTLVGLNYTNARFIDLGDTAESGPNPFNYTGTATLNSPEIHIQYQMTPSLKVGAAYSYTKVRRANYSDGAGYNVMSAGASYRFSARTQLTAIVVYQTAHGTDSLNQSAVATIDGLSASATSRQTSVRLGLRHAF